MLPFLAFCTLAALTFAIAFTIAAAEDDEITYQMTIVQQMKVDELLQEMYYDAEIGLYPNVYSEELERRGVAA